MQPCILIVEDDPAARDLFNRVLRAEGFETAYAADAYEALVVARRCDPALVLLDYHLPGGDAVVVLERLRRVAGPASSNGGHERILLVEDEPVVRRLLQTVLERKGYEVTATCCGEETLEAFARSESRFDLVVTDYVMPGICGREIAERLGREGDAPLVLFVSGYVPGHGVEVELDGVRSSFLQKPFTGDELAGRVRLLLDGSRAG